MMDQDERLAALKAEFTHQQQSDKKTASLRAKIEAGKATFSDATKYSLRLGTLLGRAFKAVLTSEEDKACLLDPDAADTLVRPLLTQSASLAGDAAAQAICTQNQAVGIGLNAQTADPQRVSDRIDGIVTSVSMQADADSALDALERESVSFTASAADESLEASGNFLASVGRSAKIVRTASANACAWCLEREGTYEYPDVPKDVFQRHANCTCTLDYYPAERSARQNAWTKEWAQETQRRTDLKTFDATEQKTEQENNYETLNLTAQPVTMESIQNVRAFQCETLDAAASKRLQIAHKNLLMEAFKQPLGVEVGKAFALDMTPLTPTLVGKQDRSIVSIPDQGTPYVAIHTHPDCNIFSEADLSRFTEQDNLKLLTAIGNDGHIYAVEKTSEYDNDANSLLVKDLHYSVVYVQDQYDSNKISYQEAAESLELLVRNCLKEMIGYGVNFHE